MCGLWRKVWDCTGRGRETKQSLVAIFGPEVGARTEDHEQSTFWLQAPQDDHDFQATLEEMVPTLGETIKEQLCKAAM